MKFSSPDLSLVFLAGIENSPESHWQRHWQRLFDFSISIEHQNWDAPNADIWVRELDQQLRVIKKAKLIIGHSLGCLLLSQWIRAYSSPTVVGAFLVALPDPSGAEFPRQVTHFDQPASGRLPFPSLLVASEDDPYSTMAYSKSVAAGWGSKFVNVGPKGHINAQSQLGNWDEGIDLIRNYFGLKLEIQHGSR
jgi:predicted alpha/beta hydrolase family esterase